MNYPFNINNNYKLALLIILFTGLLRIYYAEHNYCGISTDPANFILAVNSYNLAEDQPHLPGYYLHIQIIKLVKILTGNTHTAMLVLSILYSSLAMGFLYLLFRYWFDVKISMLLTLLVLTNPMVWFYGSITEIYSFDLFFSIVVAWLGLNPVGIYFTPLFVGLFSGVRPSSGVLILGLYLFLWYKHLKFFPYSIKKIILSHLFGLAGVLIWFVPLINSAGGLWKYISLYSVNSPLPKTSIFQNWYTFSSYIIFLAFPFITLTVYLLISYLRKNKSKVLKNQTLNVSVPKDFIYLMLSWSIPPLLFFLFYYYAKGYLLLCITPVLSLPVIFYRKRKALQVILSTAIILQIAFFCFWPYSRQEPRLYFSPEARQFSILKVWFERVNSVYLMSQSHIRSMENSEDDIEKLIAYLSNSSYDLKKHLILIDPTVQIRARALQAEHPDLKFGAISFFRDDQYKIYYGMEVVMKKGLSRMFKEALIISQKSFVNQYIKNIVRIRSSGPYILYTAQQEEINKLVRIYSSLFLHKR